MSDFLSQNSQKSVCGKAALTHEALALAPPIILISHDPRGLS